jgi:uridine kinase
MNSALFVIVSGGSGSGKTTFVNELLQHRPLAMLSMDSYYRDQSHLSLTERALIDYDTWESLDGERLYRDCHALVREGRDIHVPEYDFAAHVRKPTESLLRWQPVIVLEGIFALYDARIRELADISVFIDVPERVRYQRRLHRDMKERGRTAASVEQQWYQSVNPNYEKYIAPTKKFATHVLPVGDEGIQDTKPVIASILTRIEQRTDVR